MIKIIPAILPQTYRGIELSVEKVHGAVDTVQIDFVDGHFVPSRSWWFNQKDTEKLHALLNEEMGMPLWDTMNYEFDLMVSDPIQYMETFIALGPSKITFHVEGLDQEKTLAFFETLPEIISSTIAFGISLNIDTDPAPLIPYMPYVQSIQCMGIDKIGYQGQAFDPRVIEQIQTVHALYPEKTIAVDGGVSLENAVSLMHAGATELIVGSALFQNIDPRGTIEAFNLLCKDNIQHEN